MKNYRRLVVIVMAVTLATAAVPSGARELKGIDFPDQIQAGSDPQAILIASAHEKIADALVNIKAIKKAKGGNNA